MTWAVPKSWRGKRCYIIGGGPSVASLDLSNLPGKIIAINEAGLSVRPDADVLFFADARWYRWNLDRMSLFTGKHLVTTHPFRGGKVLKVLKSAQRIGKVKLSRSPDTLAGWCSGARAINLAYLFGAKEIVLIGFEMHERDGLNFHALHKVKPHSSKAETFIPAIVAMAEELAKEGVKVINCTPGSDLPCFPIMSLDEFHAGG